MSSSIHLQCIVFQSSLTRMGDVSPSEHLSVVFELFGTNSNSLNWHFLELSAAKKPITLNDVKLSMFSLLVVLRGLSE